jgi:hypothetical protein
MTGMLAPTRYVKAKAAWNGRPEKWYVRALVFDVIDIYKIWIWIWMQVKL